MLRTALLFLIMLPAAGCQLAVPIAATQVALPLATSQTVLRGTKQMVEIRSEPPGATVEIAGYPTRTTPTFIMLARGHSHTVRILKDGFNPVTTNLMSQRNDAAINAGNVLGNALDEASGAAWELCPSRLVVNLESAKPGPANPLAGAAPSPLGAAAGAPTAASKSPTTAAVATPPIVPRLAAQPTQPSTDEVTTALWKQIARLDRLLEQGVITRQEHQVLTAAAISAASVAGANP
ncbi:MAG TPA: PEGA domain-containing protein [Phycisphaerales bacterium]|nr:PEGA domain-containing protein [Phycisphaerales bacterium]